MKNIILLIAVMVIGACASTSTVKSVAGTYERKTGEDTYRAVFLENGDVENYLNGKKREGEEAKWKVVEGEIHVTHSHGNILVFRINKDGSITNIAMIPKDGKRKEAPKEYQLPIKKIK